MVVAQLVTKRTTVCAASAFFQKRQTNTPPETVRVDRTNGAAKPLKWCKVTAAMVH